MLLGGGVEGVQQCRREALGEAQGEATKKVSRNKKAGGEIRNKKYLVETNG